VLVPTQHATSKNRPIIHFDNSQHIPVNNFTTIATSQHGPHHQFIRHNKHTSTSNNYYPSLPYRMAGQIYLNHGKTEKNKKITIFNDANVPTAVEFTPKSTSSVTKKQKVVTFSTQYLRVDKKN
jgi:hypothetical protein